MGGAMAGDLHDVDATMDAAALYREEVFTDRRVGTIRVLTPVTAAGLPDTGRRVLYVGETQVLTAGGMLPIGFEIDAASLAEAVEKFPAGVKVAVEQTIREIQELRREAASSIVIPDLRPGGPATPSRGGIIHRP